MFARILSVGHGPRGAQLTQAAPAGATVLHIDEDADFVATSGWVQTESGTLLPFSEVGYDDEDPTLSLSAPLPEDLDLDGQLSICNSAGAVETDGVIAKVRLDDAPEEAPIEVDVDEKYVGKLPLGPRADDEAESCILKKRDDDWYVAHVIGVELRYDGAYIDPDTLPDSTVPTEVPAASPAIRRVTGFPTGLLVETDPVDISSQLRYYVVPAGNIPGPDDVVMSTRGTAVSLLTLGDGSPLAPDVDYDVYVEAFNVIGPAPSMSGPATGRLDLTAIEELIALRLVVAELVAGRLQIGQITGTPDGGITIPQPDGGVIHFPADGSAATITAYIVARGLTVEDAFALYGAGKIYGDLRLATGVSAPVESGTVTYSWPWIDTVMTATPFQGSYYGLAPRIGASGWAACGAVITDGAIDFLSSSGAIDSKVSIAKYAPLGGIVMMGTSYYVLGKDYTAGRDGNWYVRRYSSTGSMSAEWPWRAWSGVDKKPAIGTDGTDLLIAFCRPSDGGLRLEQWTTTGSQVGATMLPDAPTNIDIGGVGSGSYDFGTPRLWVARYDGGTPVMVWNSSLSARQALHEWQRAGMGVRGMCYSAGRFVSIDTEARIYSYAARPTSESVARQIAWYDPDSGGTGTHESTPGPVATSTWPARQWAKFTVPVAPEATNTDPTKQDKATHVRLYAAVGAATRTLQATLDKDNRSTPLRETLTTNGKGVEVLDGFSGVSAPGFFRSDATYASGATVYHRTELDGTGRARVVDLIQAGRATASGFTAAPDDVDVTVTFKTPFLVTPVVTATPYNVGNPDVVSLSVMSESTTGCTIRVKRIQGTASVAFCWTATTPTP